MGTMNVLEAINSGNNGLLIHTSTSETYGTAKYSPIDEIHPMQPQSPYSASKIAADALVRSFFHSFGTPVVVARPFNTYGPRQSPRAVIPTILLQALQSENQIMLGDLKPKRSFNYVEDTVSQLVLMSEKSSQLKLGDVYNLGVDEVYSIEELVKIIEKVLDTKLEIKFDPERMRPVASEVYLLSSDSSKIRECLGKISRTPMELGIEKFVNWLRNGGLKKYNSNDLHWNPL
jgi:nucleoside-diphosphate-sugar epimerase